MLAATAGGGGCFTAGKRGAPLGKEGALVADLLKLLLKIRAREIDVASRLLTRTEEMEALAAGVRDLPILQGWRYEVFGKDALELVEGRTAFAVKRGKLHMTHMEKSAQDESDGFDAEDFSDEDPADVDGDGENIDGGDDRGAKQPAG